MSVRDSDVIQAIKDKLLAECEMRTGTQEAPETLLELLRQVTLVKQQGEVRHGFADLYLEHWYECPQTAVASAAEVISKGDFNLVPVTIVIGYLEDEIDPESLSDEEDEDEVDDV